MKASCLDSELVCRTAGGGYLVVSSNVIFRSVGREKR
jgi:hypothetical protein